ncbi:C40 family peptidase [Ilyomonas limi]|nr:NlpC/P60 family protein [Ilyomonas limi]
MMAVVACMLLTSCKSLQRLSARDASAKSKTAAANKKARNIEFIDDIAVSTGKAPAPKSNTNAKRAPKVIYKPPTDIVLTRFNIEKATALQFKYAIMLDASVEKLTDTLLLQNIDHWYGTQYCMGGSTEDCIDCSAFTQIMMRDVYKVDIPRTARAQYDNSDRIAVEDLQEGDLVFFQTVGRDISHVGIYLTNNKFVHAATSNGVMVSDLNDIYWRPRFKGAGRVLKNGVALGR